MKKIIIACVSCLVILLIALSCAGGFFYYKRYWQPINVFKNASNELKNIKTAEFDIKTSSRLVLIDLNNRTGETNLKYNGSINLEKEILKTKIENEDLVMYQYLNKDKLYMKNDDDSKYTQVPKQGADDYYALRLDEFSDNQLLNQLEENNIFKYEEKAEINDKSCFYYTVDLNDESKKIINSYIIKSLENSFGENNLVKKDSLVSDGIQIKIWIDTASEKLYREYLKVDEVTFEITNIGKVRIEDLISDVTYTTMNEEIEITKPELESHDTKNLL